LPDINVDIADTQSNNTTIAGLVLAALGRIPITVGDRVEFTN
jgi:CBS domain containing-hemolysin-like protein